MLNKLISPQDAQLPPDIHWRARLYRAFDRDHAPVVRFLEHLAASYGLAANGALLDVGCGPGGICTAYAATQWQVTGLEPDPGFLAEAQKVAATLPNITVKQGSFNNFRAAAVFDMVVAINGAFAYIMTEAGRLDALRRVFDALKPGGLFFLDIPNLLWFAGHEPTTQIQKNRLDDLSVTFQRRYSFDYHDATYLQENQYTVTLADGTVQTFSSEHRHAIFFYPHIVQLLHTAGFAKLRTYNAYTDRQPQRLTGSRIMVAAQRPAAH